MSTQQRVALVTGAGRREGLGFEIARQLGAQGDHVILTARRLEQVESLAEALRGQGVEASALELDLGSDASVTEAAAAVAERFGRPDVLVDNAALMLNGSPSVEDKDMDELTAEFATNVVGTWRVIKAFVALLERSEHGRIVNVSSGAGSFWDPDYGMVNFPGLAKAGFGEMPLGAYALTKAAVNGLTIKTAKDLRGRRILVNAACPGVTATHPGTESWARPVADGARSIVWAANLPDDGPTGLFFRDGKQLPW